MITEVFLQTAGLIEQLLGHDAVAQAWDQPSALEHYTVGSLSAHLARAVHTADRYLSAPEPPPDRRNVDAAAYYQAVLAHHDPIDSDFHRTVRQRSQEAAADGHQVLLDKFAAARRELDTLLGDISLQRRVEVLAGLCSTAEEYLKTRLLELVIHYDDVAISVGLDEPDPLPAEAYQITAGLLGQIAALRHGGVQVIRSLSRKERHPEALRAF